jgi:CBS-domain-containing membrane protein
MIACLIGVGISKLLALNPHAEQYTELGGALACGLTTAIMGLTGTTHPPAGATALLAVTNSQTAGLGWFLFPIMLLGITLMQITALIVNNIQRRYPLYWWTSRTLSRPDAADEEKHHRKAGSDVASNYEDSLTEISRRVVVGRGDVWVPDGVCLSEEERRVLGRISERI